MHETSSEQFERKIFFVQSFEPSKENNLKNFHGICKFSVRSGNFFNHLSAFDHSCVLKNK